MTNNIKSTDHAVTLGFINMVNEAVATHLETTGETVSVPGLILDCIAVAADNVEGFTSTRFVIDFRGFAIEYDADLFDQAMVMDNLERALEVIVELDED